MKCLMLILVLMKWQAKSINLFSQKHIFVFTELVIFFVPKCKDLLKRGDFTLSSVKVKLEAL